MPRSKPHRVTIIAWRRAVILMALYATPRPLTSRQIAGALGLPGNDAQQTLRDLVRVGLAHSTINPKRRRKKEHHYAMRGATSIAIHRGDVHAM